MNIIRKLPVSAIAQIFGETLPEAEKRLCNALKTKSEKDPKMASGYVGMGKNWFTDSKAVTRKTDRCGSLPRSVGKGKKAK